MHRCLTARKKVWCRCALFRARWWRWGSPWPRRKCRPSWPSSASRKTTVSATRLSARVLIALWVLPNQQQNRRKVLRSKIPKMQQTVSVQNKIILCLKSRANFSYHTKTNNQKWLSFLGMASETWKIFIYLWNAQDYNISTIFCAFNS